MISENEIEKLIESLTLEEMIGQLLCFLYTDDFERMQNVIRKTHAGSVFVAGQSKEEIERITAVLNETSKIPGMIAADVEAGVGHVVPGELRFPHEMAWAANGDEKVVEEAHEAIAARCRELGIHWSFSPIVDINYNMQNSVANIRTASDDPKIVAKFGTAAVRGYQKNGFMAAGCKHFPGDGVDDRDQHFCTTINSFSRKKWMETYGYTYKEMFEEGVMSVMTTHVTLKSYDNEITDGFYPIATYSKKLTTDLLKKELGFNGVVVTDALVMGGMATGNLVKEAVQAH